MDRLPVDLLQPVSLPGGHVRSHHAAASANIVLAAWRRRGLILLLAGLSLAGGAAALGAMTRQYAAEAVLQLNLDQRERSAADERGPAVVLDAAAVVQGELRIIRSRLVARRVVERLALAAPPAAEMAPEPATYPTGLLARLHAAWDRVAGLLPPALHRVAAPPSAPGGNPGAGTAGRTEADRLQAAEDALLGQIAAESDNRSYMVAIRATAADPNRAAAIANAVATEYIGRRLEANIEAAGKSAAWIGGQIATARQQLHDAEAATDAYRAQSGLLEVGASQTLDQQRLRELADQRDAAVLASNEAQERLSRATAISRAGGVPSFADLKGSPQLLALLDRRNDAEAKLRAVLAELGPRHPQAIAATDAAAAAAAAFAAELRHGLTLLQADAAAAEKAETDLTGRLAALQRAMIDGKENEAGLRSREAAIQALRSRLDTLTRAREQLDAIRDLRPVAATLIVPAEVPRAPVSPKPGVVLPVSLAGGLGLGVFLAGLLERRDLGFRSGAEVEPILGKRCLGLVPEVRDPSGRPRSRRDAFEASLLAETVRSAGAAVGLFDGSRTCRVVLVTSAVQGEGMSVFARALAGCLAASGRRVLLVAGAPRRGWGVDCAGPPPAGSPGESQRLTVLDRSGACSLAGDVFGANDFAREIAEARSRYDVIVLEGPPVLLVADAVVLGRLADTVLHVARWSSTRQRTVAAAVNWLSESAVSVDGVVLTRVNLARHATLQAAGLGAHYLRERRFFERLAHPFHLPTRDI